MVSLLYSLTLHFHHRLIWPAQLLALELTRIQSLANIGKLLRLPAVFKFEEFLQDEDDHEQNCWILFCIKFIELIVGQHTEALKTLCSAMQCLSEDWWEDEDDQEQNCCIIFCDWTQHVKHTHYCIEVSTAVTISQQKIKSTCCIWLY